MPDLASPRIAHSVVSGTTLRFVSLVAAVLGTSTYAFGVLYTRIPANYQEGFLTYARCGELLRRAGGSLEIDPAAVEASERYRMAASQCLAPFEQTEARWLLTGVALLLAVAAVLYLVAPWWISRRSRLVPITAGEFPKLHAALRALAEEIGLRRVPAFVLDPAARAPGGLTFGRAGLYTVRVNAGLVPVRITDPPVFRAIVLHELAHIRNRDVDIAYATMALWRAFVVVALIPMIVAFLHPAIVSAPLSLPWESPGYAIDVPNILLRTAVFVLIVYLSRNAVLRTRESHADARAAELGLADGLRRAVTAAAGRPRTRWRRWLGVHPDGDTRLSAIEDPSRLLRPGFGELFGAGVTTVIAAGSVSFVADLGLPHDGTPAGRYVAWMVAPLVMGILGAVAWRAAVLSAGGERVSVLPAAMGFSLGCLVGDLVSLLNPVTIWGVFGSTALTGRMPLAGSVDVAGFSFTAGLVGAAVFTAGILIQAGVSASGARAWLPTLRGRHTRWGWAAGVAVTMVPFAVWFGIWLEIRSAPHLMARVYHLTAADAVAVEAQLWQGPGFSLWTSYYPPLTMFTSRMPVATAAIVVAFAWIYPFAARLRRRPAPTGAVSIRTAVIAGLAAAAVFAPIVVAGRAAVHSFAMGEAGFSAYYTYLLISLAVALQGTTAGVLAARHRHGGLLLGQCAASVFSVAAVTVAVGASKLGTCVPAFQLRADVPCTAAVDVPNLVYLLDSIAVKGALAALVVSCLVRLVQAARVLLPAGLLAGRPRVRSAAFATAVTGLVVVLLAAVSTLSATVDTQDTANPYLPASPSPFASASTAVPARILTQAEVQKVADAAGAGLPRYWSKEKVEPSSSSDLVLHNPETCTALGEETYLEAIEGDRRATTTVKYDDGGSSVTTWLTIVVSSYAHPVPESVFTAAEQARAACPLLRYTTDGSDIRYTITAGKTPALGQRAWRADLAMKATTSGIRFDGNSAQILIAVGHTLIAVLVGTLNEPIDERIILNAMTRIVRAIPS